MIRKDFLPLARPSIEQDEIDAVVDVVKSGWLTTGPKSGEFEHKFTQYLKGDTPLYTAGLNSCTSAMFLALKALGIKAEDEVLVPTWTFAATIHVVEWLGAVPVLCDIEPDTLNIDLSKAEKKITKKTKGMIPVHMGGYPCDLDRIHELSTNFGLKVVEDAAHAIGTRYKGRKIGNFSHVTCFSFYVTKNLTMGEGGAAVSRDKGLIDKIAQLAYFGINKEAHKRYKREGTWFYDIEHTGYKCNLDSLHAAIGLTQLEKLDALNSRRRQIARLYRNNLSRDLGFTKDSDDDHFHTYHLFQIILPRGCDRDGFISKMKECNIGCSVHFIPLHRHSAYEAAYPANTFPVADDLFERIVSIPMFPAMTDEDVSYVITHINRIVRSIS